MASSHSGSGTNNSVNSKAAFSFSTSIPIPMAASSSFMDMDNNINQGRSSSNTSINSWGLSNLPTTQTDHHKFGIEIPKFKSPSSSFSPTDFLDSTVLFSTSSIFPSPTTGAFAGQTLNWRTNSNDNNQQGNKQEEHNNFFDFSFQPQPRPSTTSNSSTFQSSSSILSVEPLTWNFSESIKQPELSLVKAGGVKTEFAPMQNFSSAMAASQTNVQSNTGFQSSGYNQYNQSSQYVRENKKVEDGYNWRKYGQKQVKGSENPRSYYKCTYPNCPTKKKVERSLDGQITEIVYKGSHNHPKPQSKRSSSHSACTNSEISDQSVGTLGNEQTDSFLMQEDTSGSIGEDDFDQASPISNPGGDDNENEPDAKRWKGENENEGIIGSGSRTVREPRIVVQTTSDIDILDDGYRWRKYGQKVVKGNPNPRSYYKCTTIGCPVRKHVERASHDLKAVITTYEGKHNHDVPAARGSGYAINRHSTANNTNAPMAMPIRPSAVPSQPNNTSYPNSLQTRLPTSGSQVPVSLEMLQNIGGFGLKGFGKPVGSYMSQAQFSEGAFARAKDELGDDSFFDGFPS
ncbi:hypothetical protein REPUB_Repub06bG0219400 [Reevesia pubescens]